MSYTDKKIVKNSLFLKVEQGSPHTIRLLDEDPTEQWQHKIGDKLTPCAGELCGHCADGHSKNQRFVANAYDFNDEKVVLWSYGPTVAEALKAIAEGLEKDGEAIIGHDLEVSVRGSGVQKKTSVQVRIKNQALPPHLKKHAIGITEKKNSDEAPW